MKPLKINPGEVKGFNYHPSYSINAMTDWFLFDEALCVFTMRFLTSSKRFKIDGIALLHLL